MSYPLASGDHYKLLYGTGADTTSMGDINTSDLASGYNDISFNALGLSRFTRSTTFSIALMSSHDISATAPTRDERVHFYSTDKGGIYIPKLTITYTIAPTVITDPATSVQATRAVLNGTLDDDGGEDCACSFEYGLTTDYGTTTATQSKIAGEAFPQAIFGLSPSRTYYFRAIATNSVGTSYGSNRTFKTTACGNINIDQLIYQHCERMRVR